jgi:energy-coupling factor transporter ATP-binding protein EcfA2
LPAIRIERLHYAYPPPIPGGAPTPVLEDVSLEVARGEFLALMGATGAGKTTLCMAMNGLVPRATGGVFRGRVTVLGQDTRETPVAQMARRVGLVFQDPESQFFSATVEDECAFGPENLGIDPREIAERVAWALDLVGMRDLAGRAPAHLSGGQKQRVAIAAVLTLLPEVLILDEPTASLDPLGQQEVVAAIERLARERDMTIVMASHDPEQIAELSDRVAILHEGHIARVDAPSAVFEDVDLLEAAGLAAPEVTDVARSLGCTHGEALHLVRLAEAIDVLGERLARGRDEQ